MLPENMEYPIPTPLIACFNDTASTYKFYWFLSILDEIDRGQVIIPKYDLFAGMLANAWHTVNYFHVSFGKQDRLQRAIMETSVLEGISIDQNKITIQLTLSRSSKITTARALNYFDSEVPHRFLSPWFPSKKGNRKEVYTASQTFLNDSLYAVDEKNISINPKWLGYLRNNSGILKSFCYWKLGLYLQRQNPNVPDISGKLFKHIKRNSLIKQRKFWDTVIDEIGGVDCIYTNRKLYRGDFVVEHFVPHAFVSHDLIWNLVPADKAFNCFKTDKLPQLDKYFDKFYYLQKQAIEITKVKCPKEKLLQDYLSIFPNFDSVQVLPDNYYQKFKETVQPLITIAKNNGFEMMV